MDSEDDVQMSRTSPELVAAAKKETLNLLSNNERCDEFAYKHFKTNCLEKVRPPKILL